MAEGTRLESAHTRKGIGGSNPSLSAICLFDVFPQFCAEGFQDPRARTAYHNRRRAGDKSVSSWVVRLSFKISL